MMSWILLGAIGGLLSLAAFFRLYRRYRRGAIRKRYFLMAMLGFLGFLCYALLIGLRPQAVSSGLMLLILLPICLAIVIIVREHQKGHAAP